MLLWITIVGAFSLVSPAPTDPPPTPPPTPPPKCGYESCPDTSNNFLNVHIVAHTHDDVGWLKTVDQYYYGSNNSIQLAGVQYILDSVIKELSANRRRRFIYVETAFFWKWWVNQNPDTQREVHRLVNNGQLMFVGGAWSMNDEAASHYQSTIDQFTWGLGKLIDTFGKCAIPRVGWQIDPFGHSREFASLLAGMGYDGLFLGRIDYQDKDERKKKKSMETLWRGDDDLGKASDIFTGVLYNTYQPPPGFCFDILCKDLPIIDDVHSPLYNVDQRMTDSANNHKKFSVVQFIALPFEGIDDYVCVPDDWVLIRRKRDQKVVVAYPKDEDRFVTRDRVKREEKYDDDWRFWTAEVKYKSDTFDEADFWIAKRNDYGPLVQPNVSLNDMPSTSGLNKELRSSNQKSTSNSEKETAEMTQKPFQITIKRPVSDKSQPQLETKRFKQSTAKDAEPTGALSQSADKEPGFSSMPAIIEDGPAVIDVDEDDHLQQDQQSSENYVNSENRLVIDMAVAQNHLQDNGSSSSNSQPQIASVESLATTSNNQEPRTDDSSNNGPPTSGYQLESIATQLYEKMKGKQSLVAKHPVVEKKMRFENITRNVAILLKDPPNSMNLNQPRQEPRILPTNRTSQFIHPGDIPVSTQEIQHVARINNERNHNAFENPRVVLQNIASVVSAAQNLPSSPQQRPNVAQLDGHYQNSLAPDQHRQQTTRRSPYGFNTSDRMREILIQQRRHMPGWGTRRPVVPPTLPRSRRSTPLPQENTRNTRSLLFPNLPDSIQQALLATRSRFLSDEEELQGHLAQGTQIIETPPDPPAASVYGVVHQNLRMQIQRVNYSNERNQVYFQDDIDRSPSASDSAIGMDHDGMFDLGVPREEALVGKTNNVNGSQGGSRFISQQQMKDQFASTSAQISSTLNCMVNAFENLRTSVLQITASHQTLLENMERFNSPENSSSQASTSRNVAQEVPLVAEEREITATRSVNLTGDQHRNDVVNEAPERNFNPTSRLTLPPEYDPDDTRWTLKHHEHMPGLVELMPHSNIYVSYSKLKYSEQTSYNCPALARRILLEVFSKKALSVCSSMTVKGHDYSIYPDERPKLDEHACLVLLNYILEHGLQCGWKTDLQPILKALHDKVKEIRFRYGVMSRC